MKNKTGFPILITAFALLTGCVANKQMTRAEWLQYTSRHYPGVTVDRALVSAEKLFTLADGPDFRFSHTSNKLNATRRWSFYAVLAAGFGSDHWIVEAVEKDGGVDMQISVGVVSSMIGPMPTARGDTSAVTMPTSAMPPPGNALYDLFWRRMDYLLGKSSHWTTCQEADKLNNGGDIWGSNEALCNVVNIEDVNPETGKSTYAMIAQQLEQQSDIHDMNHSFFSE